MHFDKVIISCDENNISVIQDLISKKFIQKIKLSVNGVFASLFD